MGADLYIAKLSKERKTNEMAGYFRDPYNSYDLLWQFGLSWWEDILPLEDKDGNISPKQAKDVLEWLQLRQGKFESNMLDLINGRNHAWDFEYPKGKPPVLSPDEMSLKERGELVKSYRKRYQELQAFLNKAIELKSNIICSL